MTLEELITDIERRTAEMKPAEERLLQAQKTLDELASDYMRRLHEIDELRKEAFSRFGRERLPPPLDRDAGCRYR